jgi:hypothetical protein
MVSTQVLDIAVSSSQYNLEQINTILATLVSIHDPKEAELCASDLARAVDCIAADLTQESLPEVFPVLHNCYDVRSFSAQCDLQVHEAAGGLLAAVQGVLANVDVATNHDVPFALDHWLPFIAEALQKCALSRMTDLDVLCSVGAQQFDRLLNIGSSAMSNMTLCIINLLRSSVVQSGLNEVGAPSDRVLSCAHAWISTLLRTANSALCLSKRSDTPSTMRIGLTMSTAWKEVVNVFSSIPARIKSAFVEVGNAALSQAWSELVVRSRP